ncbi:MAG: thymidylate synthase [Clostridia bacterium]|nr:thymidylate synthase [Clostridia bacterium]
MSRADEQYLAIISDILDHGYYDTNRTVTNTYKLPHKIMQFDLEQEFPILTTKKVAFKTATKELLWIYRDQSNDVLKLQEQNVHIWDEWMMEDGTIGTAYGWIVGKYHLIDNLIEGIKRDPQGRRHIMSLWQNEWLDTGSLHPCAFMTMWDVTDGRLNCMLVQRSADMGLGVPFNMSQYALLAHIVAQCTGYRPGIFTHVINNAHIYENHVEQLRGQLGRLSEAYPAPKLWINPDKTSIYDFTADDVKLIDYRYHDTIKMDVSV